MGEGKRYYKIGEVCKIAGIRPHLLRYWEKEIKTIKAHRSLKNHRLYSQEALEHIKKIKMLLDEGYKLETIKTKLGEKENIITKPNNEAIGFIKEVKKDLQKIKTLLEC